MFWEEDEEPELLPEIHEEIPHRLLEMTAWGYSLSLGLTLHIDSEYTLSLNPSSATHEPCDFD